MKARPHRVALNLLILLGLLVLTLSSCKEKSSLETESAKDTDLTSLAAIVSQKVVSVETVGDNPQDAKTGSGFFVSADGKVVTCAHVIQGAKTIRVKTLNGAEFKFESVVFIDESKDLAILSVAADGVAFFEHSDSAAPVGTRIAVLGNPLGLKGSLTDGVISAIRGGNGISSYLQISAPVSQGSSGSPVLLLNGHLVGMVGSRAQDGEGLGFALAAKEIWSAISQPSTDKVKKVAYREALKMSRKRYLPSAELFNDPEWNNGQLPTATSQRLAVLNRLKSKYPDVATIRIEIAKALETDSNHDEAFGEYATLVRDDPGNRLALNYLINVIVREEKKLPYVKSSLSADPLNFHARIYLSKTEGRNKKFLASQLSARRALETAPFSLRISEGYADSLISTAFYDLAILNEPYDALHGEIIRRVIVESNDLRRIIISAGLVISKPSEEAIDNFIKFAKRDPARSLPYAWELAHYRLESENDVGDVFSSPAGDRLAAFIRETIQDYPLITETYLLDPGSVDLSHGLLLSEITRAWTKLLPGLGINDPFDKIGMIFLMADKSPMAGSDASVESPEELIKWLVALEEYAETVKELGGIYPHLYNLGKGEWQEPLVFRFWLATQKKRFENKLITNDITVYEKEQLEVALRALKEIPSIDAAEHAVRALNNRRSTTIWNYYGEDYM